MKVVARLIAIPILIFLSSSSTYAQTLVTNLKKKNFGTYQGKIPAYNFISDTTTVAVDAATISVQITENAIAITLGNLTKKGSYHILFKGKDYYVIDAYFEGDRVTERLVLNEKMKTIMREGIHPQPNANLSKTKK